MSAPSFYNTLGRRAEVFEPLAPGQASIYTCGPTVYDSAHIGNLRTFLFEDILCRSLELFGFEVTQVMNLTDVEDKIIRAAIEREASLEEIVAAPIEAFFRDLGRLGIREAERYPRATDHIPEMIALVERLLERGYAYVADGSVFFRIDRDEDYGKLSGVDPGEQRRGERVADDEYGKEDVRDFVLWKAAKEGEPRWDSPWGPGRPGWHIECSAMSMKYLGETFDIHCGGVDNVFPHHENEIAQSESATGKPFARYWLHSEHLLVDGQKMSKSLGNQYTVDDLLERGLDLRAVRYLFLSVHYRQKLNFTFRSVENAAAALRRLDELRFRLENASEREGAAGIGAAASRMLADFEAALAEDLNVSGALAALHTFVREANTVIEAGELAPGDREVAVAALRRVDGVLGVLDPEPWRRGEGAETAGLDDDEVEKLVAQRTEARRLRDFAEADAIRDRLEESGVVIEDLRDGVRWKRI